VRPEPESRLEQLTARYGPAKAKATEAEAELTEIKDGIKAELARLHPEATTVLLNSPHLTEPLQLQAVSKWGFDSKRCKAEHPAIYAAFARQSTSWTLRALAG
jgi:hypothetical protein